MATTRDDVRAALAACDPEDLRAILLAARVRDGGSRDPVELADRVVRAIWWHATTPLGYAMDRTTFEDVVDRVARRLDLAHRATGADAWERLEHLTRALVSSLPEAPGIALSDLDAGVRRRLRPHWKRTLAFGGGGLGSFGARAASGAVIGFLEGPVGRLLPLLPPLAPYVRSVRAGAGAVRAVSGPLGLALTAASINQALGPDYRTLLPLLLGVGALGPRPVVQAEEPAA